MELKNNNPGERKSTGKVLGHIAGCLRSMARPKKNTKWDYIVPLSLIGLVVLSYNYGSMNYEVFNPNDLAHEAVEKSLWEIKDILFAELIFGLLVILTTIFLTRVQRLLVLPTFLIFLIGEFSVSYKADVMVSISEPVMGIVILSTFFAIPYFLSSLSLLTKFGNNSKEKICKKSTPIRSAVAWGVYGFGLNILPFFTRGGEFIFIEIFDPLYPIMQKLSTPLDMFFFFSFFTILFALIGYSIEKYKQKKEAKTK